MTDLLVWEFCTKENTQLMVAGIVAIYWEYVSKLFLFLRGRFFFPYAQDNNILISMVFEKKANFMSNIDKKHIEIICWCL